MYSTIFCLMWYNIAIITNRHIRITSWTLPLFGGAINGGRGTTRGLTSREGLAGGVGALGATGTEGATLITVPFIGLTIACGGFFWWAETVNFNLALPSLSVNLIVLVWKPVAEFKSFFVISPTKWLVVAGFKVRGGGAGASDTSISLLVETIG